MIATNSVAPISGSLRAQVQQLRAAALSKQEFEGLDPDVVGSLTDILDQAESILTVFADEEERVQANADLSEAGRTKAMTKAVRAAHDKLRVIEKKAAERRQAYESESAVISAAPKPSSDSLVSAVRELDIQRRLQTAPLHEQMKAYKIASDNGWGSTMRALKDVEVFGEDLRLTSYIQRVDQERFEAKEPKRASRLKALKYSAEVLQALALGIDFRLSGYAEVPSFQGKPTGTMNLGLPNSQQAPKKSAADKAPADVALV
ncbi:MAG: hypothetical protein KF747_15420 [Nitrospira sp.]|nr:hypothetical protein [Nitrospira sp.]